MKKIDSNLNEKLGAYIVEYAMCKADMSMGTQLQAIYENPDGYPYFRRMCDTCIRWAMGNMLEYARMAQEFVYNRVINNIRVRNK